MDELMIEKCSRTIKIVWILQIIFLLPGIIGVLLLGLEIFAGHMNPDRIIIYAYMVFGTVISSFFGLVRMFLAVKKRRLENGQPKENGRMKY